MKLNSKNTSIFNWTIFTYLLLILLLLIQGEITFGYGLGDFAYLFGTGIITLIYLAILILSNRGRNTGNKKRLNIIMGLIFLTIVIYLTYGFTIGRGIEYRWNGNVFIN